MTGAETQKEPGEAPTYVARDVEKRPEDGDRTCVTTS